MCVTMCVCLCVTRPVDISFSVPLKHLFFFHLGAHLVFSSSYSVQNTRFCSTLELIFCFHLLTHSKTLFRFTLELFLYYFLTHSKTLVFLSPQSSYFVVIFLLTPKHSFFFHLGAHILLSSSYSLSFVLFCPPLRLPAQTYVLRPAMVRLQKRRQLLLLPLRLMLLLLLPLLLLHPRESQQRVRLLVWVLVFL